MNRITNPLALSLVSVVAAVGASPSLARAADPAPARPAGEVAANSDDGWRFTVDAPTRGVGLETSVLWPGFPGSLYLLRTAWTVPDAQGALLVGLQGHVPHDRDDEGEFASLALQLGWRQYLWSGLHLEGVVNAGWGRLRGGFSDAADYDSFDVELAATVGWRFGFGPLYAIVQPAGLAAVVYKSNPWPIRGEAGRPRTEGPIYLGNVLIGVTF